VGRGGDFYTSVSTGPLFGELLAWQCLDWIARQPNARTRRWTLLECGAHDGSLARDILTALDAASASASAIDPALVQQIDYVLMEPSLSRRAWQESALAPWSGRVRWINTWPAEGIHGVILSNELLDAFPVDVVHWDGTAWREVWSAQGAREELRPLDLPNAEAFSVLRTQPAAAQRCELATTLRKWFVGWLPQWRGGSMLAIDYGDEFPALYHRRPRGTLRAYLMQQRLEGADVFANPGRQDITCDVNFTDWRAWLTDAGLSEVLYETQAAFLQRGGQVKSQADHFVQEVGGAGTAFQCHAVRRV
jgi:SAM-dependent MidA family methyltransferase